MDKTITIAKAILTIAYQAIAQTAIIALVPEQYRPYLQGLAVMLGLIIAYLDPTSTIAKLGMTKSDYLGAIEDKNK